MKDFGQKIGTAKKPEKPLQEKQLPEKAMLWAAEVGYGNMPNGDSNRFPTMKAIISRYYSNRPNPLATFGKAISQAQERVWIIDKYFLEPDKDKGNRQDRVRQILNWIPETIFANSIRLLTKSHNTDSNKEIDINLAKQFQEHAETINACRPRGAAQLKIEIKFTLIQNFDYIHDRFAIIDDELWHFGATVGGFHSQVNAATRGWRASDYDAEEFFILAWEEEPQMGRKAR